ncbi:MAG: sigma-54 dependent transcriptional regulator [Puniceicoccales bacterium]|jgi:DNA-binding NtrC family response regulator|nr:sigma-54 dependent transcriptional regulator [Puniceicoccales bacterium]
MSKLLIVDDEKNTREALKELLQDSWDVYLAANANDACLLLRKESVDVVLTDLRMSPMDGLQFLDKLHPLSPAPPCIVMTAYGDIETAVKAMKRGAFDFISKPLDLERLRVMLRQAANENKRLHAIGNGKSFTRDEGTKAVVSTPIVLQNNAKPLPSQWNFLCAPDSPLVALKQKSALVAKSNASVLLQGETGTGKEIFANWIHYHSPRASGPMVTVHCAALPENLLESELFGHERGAFTGAMNRHVGYFERAQHGTIFLDEIGEINLQTQVKLLRFIETLQIERVGGTEPMTLDVRLITATHRPLEAMIQEGSFREDLYYRLNVIKLQIPALRDRPMDIPILLDFYLQKACYDNGIAEKLSFSSEALDALQHYFWPGNIRELRHTCESAAILMPEDRNLIHLNDLDTKFVTQLPVSNIISPKLVPVSSPIYLEDHQEKLTQQKLQKALEKAKGNKTLAAKQLGISRRTLYRKMRMLHPSSS